MADQADVEIAMCQLISAALYPSGTASPSVIGALCSIERGWPTEAGVAAAVNAGNVLITVHHRAGYSKDATRYPRGFYTLVQLAPTLTAALSGDTITFGGTVTAGNTVGVLCGGIAYTYVAGAMDTLTTIAVGLAAAIPGATASGAVLTLPAGSEIDANGSALFGNGSPITLAGGNGNSLPAVAVVNGGTSAAETAREQGGFGVDVWAPSPALRDAVFAYLPPAITYNYRMTLADSTVATLTGFQEAGPDDMPSREKMFRRNLLCFYDWPVVYTSANQAVAALIQTLSINSATALDYATV